MLSRMSSAIVGSLACQKESYLKTLKTTVVSCTPVKNNQYHVELKDTILFPEGGGQPSDTGSMKLSESSIPVTYVFRDGVHAKHIVSTPLEPGTEVELELDWARRLDHMQQHTGQHLLSAVLDKMDLPTLSWSMNEMVNYLEIPRKMTDEEILEVSEKLNAIIFDQLPINVEVPEQAHDEEKGVMRIVHIGDLDANPCCGTHMANTGHIKAISLLHQEKIRGTNSKLHFVCGDRVTKYLRDCHNLIRSTNTEMSCTADVLVDRIQQLNLSYRKTQSRETKWMQEVVEYQTDKLLAKLETSDVAALYKDDCAIEYLNQLQKNTFKKIPEGKVIVLCSRDSANGGAVMIYGNNADKITEISGAFKEAIKNLKGGGKGKWQGKVTAFEKGEFESIKRYIESF